MNKKKALGLCWAKSSYQWMHNEHALPKISDSCFSALKASPTFPMNCHFRPSEGEHPAIHSHPFLLAPAQFICDENVAPRTLCQCNPIQRNVCSRSQESLLIHRGALSAEEPPSRLYNRLHAG